MFLLLILTEGSGSFNLQSVDEAPWVDTRRESRWGWDRPVWTFTPFEVELHRFWIDKNHITMRRLLEENPDDRKNATTARKGLAGLLASEGRWEDAWQQVREIPDPR